MKSSLSKLEDYDIEVGQRKNRHPLDTMRDLAARPVHGAVRADLRP
ncbi:hypothetical protein [Rhizobium leguminosarum]|nr:hypothetical protein [Rhizobium leguminosarum]